MAAIVLGKIDIAKLMSPETSERVMEILHPLVEKTNSPGTVRALQAFKSGPVPKFRTVPWNSKKQIALHQQFGSSPYKIEDLIGFHYFAMFPDQSKWIGNTFPELFFKLETHVVRSEYELFTCGFLLIIQANTLAGDTPSFEKALNEIIGLIQGTFAIRKVAHYREKLLIGGLTNYLTDIYPSTIFAGSDDYTLDREFTDWEITLSKGFDVEHR